MVSWRHCWQKSCSISTPGRPSQGDRASNETPQDVWSVKASTDQAEREIVARFVSLGGPGRGCGRGVAQGRRSALHAFSGRTGTTAATQSGLSGGKPCLTAMEREAAPGADACERQPAFTVYYLDQYIREIAA